MLEDQALLITQFVTLWAMLDPVGHAPLFMSATEELDTAGRRKAAILGVCFAFLILLFFGLAGPSLLHAMGISLLSFQIAGGIVLLMFAISMVLGEAKTEAGKPASVKADPLAIAVFPVATPIIAGPGSMLVIIVLTDNNRYTKFEQLETFAMLALVLACMAVIFLLGDLLLRIIGKGGANLLRRIMGMILAGLSVNLILNATAQWLGLPPI